jgi:hypothetical protein
MKKFSINGILTVEICAEVFASSKEEALSLLEQNATSYLTEDSSHQSCVLDMTGYDCQFKEISCSVSADA